MTELDFNANWTKPEAMEDGFLLMFDENPFEIEIDEWDGFQIVEI